MPNVLLVDDDTEQLKIRRLILERHGHSIRCAECAEDALREDALHAPDCVVMDLRIPSAEKGLSLLEELKSQRPERPVLVLTGYPQDLEGTPAAPLANALLKKPVRSESLLAAISRFAVALLIALLPAAAAEFPFDVSDAAAETVATLLLEAGGADWAVEGKEGALARISVDGGPVHYTWAFAENKQPATVFLGRLPAGRHTLKVERDGRSAAGAGLEIRRADVTSVSPSDAEYQRIAHAPVLFARANTLGKFTDVPMLTYVTERQEGSLRVLEYTVIFSNEDGGTSTRNLMARWGRVTDIEYVYRVWVDTKGRIAKTLIQTRGHKDVPYMGQRFHQHPYLQPVTDNNMVEPVAPDAAPVRFQLSPVFADLSNGARELVMDRYPFTYTVSEKELVRERKLRAPMTFAEELIAPPSNYLTVEMKLAQKNGAVQALAVLDGSNVVYGSATGRDSNFVDRDGWLRVTIELPPDTKISALSALAVECAITRPPQGQQAAASSECGVEAFGRVFLRGEDVKVQGTPSTLVSGQTGIFTVVR